MELNCGWVIRIAAGAKAKVGGGGGGWDVPLGQTQTDRQVGTSMTMSMSEPSAELCFDEHVRREEGDNACFFYVVTLLA